MNRIKKLREENGITQEDLAKKLEMSKGIISLYEKDERKPSLEVLLKLSEIFDCSIDYILCQTDIRNSKEIKIDDIDMAFATGVKGLNDENKETLKNIMEGLLAKQELEKNSNNKKE